jgi:hypothetical protein
MTDKQQPTEVERQADPDDVSTEMPEMDSRRAFLLGLGKWSQAVVFGAVAGGVLLPERSAQAGWINRRGGIVPGGGSWINRRGGGWGGSWVNRR